MTETDYLMLGEARFSQFVKIIQKLFVDERKQFDLIVGVGNSGVPMVKFTELVLTELNMQLPPTLTLPIQRFIDENQQDLFNNEALLTEAKKQLEGVDNLHNILFVDDEIDKGISLKAAIQLIKRAKNVAQLKVTVLAENQGFTWNGDIPNIDVQFYPFSEEFEGHNNVIFYMIPSEFDESVKNIFPEDVLKWYTRINVMMGLPIKTIEKGIPVYTLKFNLEAEEKIPHFKQLQEDFLTHVKKLIKKMSYSQ